MSDNNKDGFYGIITGTVERVGSSRNGTYVRVAFKPNPNAQYPERATAWGVEGEVMTGDRVKISGQVSVRKSERDGKTYIDTSVNFPKMELLGAAQGQSEPVAAGDSWNTPGDFDSSVPF